MSGKPGVAHEYGIHTRFIELAGQVNHAMPDWVVGKVIDALNGHGKPLKGSRILILGVAYKKNVDDLRESPALAMMELLLRKGAELAYSDPHVPSLNWGAGRALALTSLALSPESLAQYDCVLIATHHDRFDWALIKQHARLIVDSRGVYREPASHIIRA